MPAYDKDEHIKIQAKALNLTVGWYANYFQRVLKCCPSQSSHEQKKWPRGHHKYVPSHNVAMVISCIKMVRDHILSKGNHGGYIKMNFLDCGCGVGNVLLLAKSVSGFYVTGLEYEPEACAIAKELVNGGRIIQCDILEFEHYSKYDIIYYYVPFSDEAKQRRFTERVCDNMKVGAVVITYGGGSHYLSNDKRLKPVFSNRFRSIPKDIRCMAWEKVKE